MLLLVVFCFFVIFAVVMFAFVFGANYLEAQRRKQVTQVLRTVEGKPKVNAPRRSVLRTEKKASPLDGFQDVSALRELDKRLQQSATGWSLTTLLSATLVCAAVGLFLSFQIPVLISPFASAVALCLGLGSLPYLYVRYKRAKRFDKFEEQLPDALDFLARSIRAGHALTISLELVADESPEPLRAEFRTLCNEQSLGAPLETALQHMAERVPLLDVEFLTSTLILQRETGGNLGEILNKLSYVMRERFRLKGQVKASSAHGKLTGTILTLLPVVVCIGLMLVSPDYLKGMYEDQIGKYLIAAAILGQVLGYAFIRKIVNIKI